MAKKPCQDGERGQIFHLDALLTRDCAIMIKSMPERRMCGEKKDAAMAGELDQTPPDHKENCLFPARLCCYDAAVSLLLGAVSAAAADGPQ